MTRRIGVLILEGELRDLNRPVGQTLRGTLQTIIPVMSLPHLVHEKMLSHNKKFKLRKIMNKSIKKIKFSFKVYKIASSSWKPNVSFLTICKKRTNFSKRGWSKLSRPKKL